MTPDDVLAELQRIRAEQSALDPDSGDFRALENRRLQLADLAQLALDGARDRNSLERELEHLEARIRDMDDDRIEVPSWQLTMTRDGRFAINDPRAHASQINAALDSNAQLDRAAMEARIEQLKQTLTE